MHSATKKQKVQGKVNWEKRNQYYLSELKNVYKDLYNRTPPVRLSKTMLINCLGYNTIWFNIDKLPNIKQYLSTVCESIEDFRLRRIKFVAKKLFMEKGYIRVWELLPEAGISTVLLSEQAYFQDIIKNIIHNLDASNKFFG